jgi:hypothetical protein
MERPRLLMIAERAGRPCYPVMHVAQWKQVAREAHPQDLRCPRRWKRAQSIKLQEARAPFNATPSA